MSRIHVVGGTGYTGAALVRESARRGHTVSSIGRRPATDPVDGVSYTTGSILDPAVRARAAEDCDVLISAAAPRGEMQAHLYDADLALADQAASQGVRFIVIGGFSAVRTEPGGPRLADTGSMPSEFAGEAREMARIVDQLENAAPAGLAWLYVSPPPGYGAHTPSVPPGPHRTAPAVMPDDLDFEAVLPAGDLASAILDEIDAGDKTYGHILVYVPRA